MKRRFISTPSIAPAKLAVCASFAVLPSNFKRPYLFNRSADLGEFYVQSKGFPCSTWKSSDFGRMDEKKRGPFFLMWGFFRVKNTKVAPPVTYGTGLLTLNRDSFAMLSSICTCYMWKHEAPFHFNPVYRPRKVGSFVPFFAVLPSNFKRPYLFNRSADLGEFYVQSKGFPCSTWKSSDFGRMDEKRGGLSSSCGAFSGLKIPKWHLPVTYGTGLLTGPRFVCHVVLNLYMLYVEA